MTKKAGSGSVSQRYGSADPDALQNDMDPEHCLQGGEPRRLHHHHLPLPLCRHVRGRGTRHPHVPLRLLVHPQGDEADSESVIFLPGSGFYHWTDSDAATLIGTVPTLFHFLTF
jgi:hypothetical protein